MRLGLRSYGLPVCIEDSHACSTEGENTSHLLWTPLSTSSWRWYTTSSQRIGELVECARSSATRCIEIRNYIGRTYPGLSAPHGRGCTRMLWCTGAKSWIAELRSTRFGRGQSGARSLGDKARFQFRDGSHLRQQELADWPRRHLGKIAEHHAAFPGPFDDGQQEARVPRQPVELGNDEGRAPGATGGQRCGELGSVVPLPALHFLELGSDRPADPREVASDGGALCVEAQARAALAICGDAEVGDEACRPGGGRA